MIGDIDELQYLKSFLCESVQASINELSLSSSNYNEAVELLKQIYGNTQMLINAHMKKFVQLPVIKNNNDINGLKLLYDQIESSVRNLKSLNVGSSGYGTLLVQLINDKRPFHPRQCITKKLIMKFGI